LSVSLLLALLTGSTAIAAEEKPAPPDVAIQIVPQTEGVEPGEELILFLSITNRSAVPLNGLLLQATGEGFSVALPAPPSSLPPFGSAWGHARVIPSAGASFGKHQIPFLLRYRWRTASAAGASLQTATATVEVRRWLDEEAKGLPGGTAALFSLLFPIIPAFLAFQLLDRLRQKKGLHLPTFDSAYIVPAFFNALLVNSLPLFPRFRSLDLTPRETVLLSLLFGALWPIVRWIWDLLLSWLWGFRESDSPRTYLRKALFSPWSPRPFTWISGKIGDGGESWSGLLLRQPGGSLVLGSTLEISYARDPTKAKENAKENAEELVARVNETGSLTSRCRLWWRVVRSGLSAAVSTFPTQGAGEAAQATDRIVVYGEEIEGLKRTKSERKGLLEYSQ